MRAISTPVSTINRSTVLALLGGLVGLYSLTHPLLTEPLQIHVASLGQNPFVSLHTGQLLDTASSHPVLVGFVAAGLFWVVVGSLLIMLTRTWGTRLMTVGASLILVPPIISAVLTGSSVEISVGALVLLVGAILAEWSRFDGGTRTELFGVPVQRVGLLFALVGGFGYYVADLRVTVQSGLPGDPAGVWLAIFRTAQVLRMVGFVVLLSGIVLYLGGLLLSAQASSAQ